MSIRTAGAAAASLVAVLLTGCTATAAPADAPAAAPSAADQSPSPVPAVPSSTPSSTPTTAPTAAADGCVKRAEITFVGTSEGDEEPVWTATWNGVDLVDRGPRDHARGKVTKDANGRLVYTVASDDAPAAIAERLCTRIYSFESYFGYSPTLYIDDVIRVPDGMQPNVGVAWTRPPMQY